MKFVLGFVHDTDANRLYAFNVMLGGGTDDGVGTIAMDYDDHVQKVFEDRIVADGMKLGDGSQASRPFPDHIERVLKLAMMQVFAIPGMVWE